MHFCGTAFARRAAERELQDDQRNEVGQFGTMEIEDSGGAIISVTWKGYKGDGTELTLHEFDISV